MFSTILSKRAKALLTLGWLLVGFGLPQRPVDAAHPSNMVDVYPDWRLEQVGRWDCQGISTLAGTGVEPYSGSLNNQWARQRSWVTVQFDEHRLTGQPFEEKQLWEYDPATGLHSRTLVTNDGSWGVLTSQGPQGNIMQWEGPFGEVFLSETLTRVSAREYQWYGEMTAGEQQLGYYQLTCNKVFSPLVKLARR